MRVLLIFCIIWALLYISACSSHIEQAQPGPRILPVATEPAEAEVQILPAITTDELLLGYQDVFDDISDETKRRGVKMRLADLQLLKSEDLLVEGIQEPQPFAKAILLYEKLLATSTDTDEKLRLKYQLSKAYALAGRNTEASDALVQMQSVTTASPDLGGHLMTESRFRLAEEAFNLGEYESAQNFYTEVLRDKESEFQQNAQYMQGWTAFKRNRYDEALQAFIAVLDFSLDEQNQLENLSKAERNLVEDSLRAMAIAFSYMGGVDSIVDTLDTVGQRAYSHLLYTELGGLYRSQDRFRDAADTYLAFVEAEPFSPRAPEFSLLAIDIHYQGNFPSLILDAKSEFVARYGYNSLFWLAQRPEDLETLKPSLHTYLQELASHYHSLAQTDQIAEPESSQLSRNLLVAADYYEEFVLTFPEDERAPEMAFLQAEALFEAGRYALAADVYEFVAYQQISADNSFANKSAYNYILAIDQVLTSELDELALFDWSQRKLQSLIRFANSYPEDERAQAVLAEAMNLQFKNQEYAEVILIADRLRTWSQPENLENWDNYIEIKRHATFVSAQSQFVLGNYFAAEMLFRQLLEDLPAEDPRYADSEQQIAVSLYRQAELLKETDPFIAVDRFIAAADFLPQSDTGTTARFDAANLLMNEQQWQPAIEQFLLFSERYPGHQLNADIPAKLAVLYQETSQWKLAADNLLILALAENQDEALQSQSVYLAAELYLRAGEKPVAKKTFQSYVEEYAESQLLRMEAQYQLTELTQGGERDRWVKALANTEILDSDRERYLCAWANSEIANIGYQRYAAIKLSLPLNRSLKIKQQAMQEALDAYTHLLQFGVAEFSTLASFRMGEIYADLSKAMMDSERPADLDTLALEQYDILLEEQAFPFEEKAIDLHEANARRSWEGQYDSWVQKSIQSLGQLLPARYAKTEWVAEVSYGIH